MSFRHASAQDWAHDHSLADDVSYGRLEIMAFQHHPDIYSLFGSSGALLAERESTPTRSAPRRMGAAFVIILAILGVVAPVAGAAMLVGDRFSFYVMDASTSVPIAGICFIVASVMQLVLFITWLVGGGRFDWMLAVPVLVAVVSATFALINIPASAERDGYEGWELWYPAAVVCLVLSGLVLLAMLTRFRVRREEVMEQPAALPSQIVAIATIRSLVTALQREERVAIMADRDEALATLHARGLIDAGEWEHARAQPIGMLFTLDDEPGTAGVKRGST